MRWLVAGLGALLAVGACTTFGTDDPAALPDGGAPADSGVDGPFIAPPEGGAPESGPPPPVPACDPSKSFGTASAESAFTNADQDILDLRFSSDGLSAFYALGTAGGHRLTRETRPTTSDLFGNAKPLAVLSTGGDDLSPSVSDNHLVFTRIPGGGDAGTIYASAHAKGDTYAMAGALDMAINDGTARDPFVTADGTELYFVRGVKVFVAQGAGNLNFGTPNPLSLMLDGAPSFVGSPVVSPDHLTLYYGAGSATDVTIFRVHRATASLTFDGPPQRLSSLHAGGAKDTPSFVSSDDCTLWFTSNRAGARFAPYRASRAQ